MATLHEEYDAEVLKVSPWGTDVRIADGQSGFIDNLKNLPWVTDEASLDVGETVAVVVIDDQRDPVRVSMLPEDFAVAGRLRNAD